MLDSAAAWQDENAYASPGGAEGYSDYECRRYFLDGDSVVNDTAYWILRVNGLLNHSSGGSVSESYYWGVFLALLREDTVERRVYIRPDDSPMEFLFYDFSVGVGPYPATWRFGLVPGLNILDVDTVLLTDGPHRRLLMGPDVGIIEGVGYTPSFMESTLWGTVHWLGQLICHKVEDLVNYEMPSGLCPCGFNMDIPTRSSTTLQIGPSPTTDVCYLYDAPPNATYLIRSMDARIVCSGKCSNSGTTTVDLADLPPAIYQLEIAEEKGPITAKIVKQ